MTPRVPRLGALLLALSLAGASAAIADGRVSVGDMGPDFTLRDQQGRSVRLADLRGRPVVLAFIVKSFTGG